MNVSTRARLACLAFAVLAVFGVIAGNAVVTADGAAARVTLNGTKVTGVRGPTEMIAMNGTQLTGVREPKPADSAFTPAEIRLAALPIR